MGTSTNEAHHFCGETPSHDVELSAFAIATVPVTNDLFGLFDHARRNLPRAEGRLPVADVTWHDATTFAAWMGCRLPTEAEWEFACGGGSAAQWCCASADELTAYAWFSQNSDDCLHNVATRQPNSLGLFDMHGNVWEWCADAYDQDFYARSPLHDPANAVARPHGHRVCRGGSIFALAEMCRSRYRLHEPEQFWAQDLGFRLARDGSC